MTIKPPLPEEDLYEYNAYIAKKYDGVYDGDTIYINVDMGMHIGNNVQGIRLKDVWAPEIRGEEREDGLIVEAWVQTRLNPGDQVRIRTYKDKQSFTRWVADVWRKDDDGNWIHLNEEINNWMKEHDLGQA